MGYIDARETVRGEVSKQLLPEELLFVRRIAELL